MHERPDHASLHRIDRLIATARVQGTVRIYLVRHTPVAVSDGACYGRTDVPLRDDWPGAVERTIAKLPEAVGEVLPVLSSPAQRCVTLARTMTDNFDVDARLAEFDFGDWERGRWDQVPPAELDAWNADLAQYVVPGGESLAQVSQRACAVLHEQLVCAGAADGAGHASAQSAIWVSHGGVIRALLVHALHMPLAAVFKLQVDYGSVSCLECGPRGMRVAFVNR